MSLYPAQHPASSTAPTWQELFLRQWLAGEGVGGVVEEVPDDGGSVYHLARGKLNGVFHQRLHEGVCGGTGGRGETQRCREVVYCSTNQLINE